MSKKREDENYTFLEINKKQYKLSWIVILPLYFYILKNFCIIPVARLCTVNTETASFMPMVALIRNTLILILIIIVYREYMRDALSALSRDKISNTVKWLLRGFLYVFVARIVDGIVCMVINHIKPEDLVNHTSENQQRVNAFLDSNIGLAVISTVLIAPIVEEMVFRVVIFHTMRKANVFFAIIGSSVIFGILHVWKELISGSSMAFVYAISYFGTAMALSILYEKRKNIILCILLHMMVNIISIF